MRHFLSGQLDFPALEDGKLFFQCPLKKEHNAMALVAVLRAQC
jgi:hypothetical protein